MQEYENPNNCTEDDEVFYLCTDNESDHESEYEYESDDVHYNQNDVETEV